MPRRRPDNSSDENSSSSSSEDDSSDSSKRPDHKRARKDHKLKSSPSRVVSYSRDGRPQRDDRPHRDDSDGRKQTSTSKYKSSDSYRRRSPAQESRRADNRSDSRRREKDRQDYSDRRNRDTDHRKAGDDRDRTEHRQRSRDRETEKNKRAGDAKSSSYSKDKGSSSKGSREKETYVSKKTDIGRKDQPVNVGNRKERNEDEKTKKSSTKDSNEDEKTKKSSTKDSNEKENSKIQQSTDIPTDDRSHKSEIAVESETKIKQVEKDSVREKKRKESSSSSSSSDSEEHQRSSSDSDSDSDDSNRNYKRLKAAKESVNVQIQQEDVDKPVERPQQSEERVVTIVEETDNTQKDTVERRRSPDNRDAGSDTSDGETKEPEEEDSHEAEDIKKELLSEHQEIEDENKDTAEKEQNDTQEKDIINESRDDDSNEEKEEGEISEDNENEDKPPAMPLKAISEYVSDISSEEGQSEAAEFKKDKLSKKSSTFQDATPTSQNSPQKTKESVETSSQKPARAGRSEKRTVDVLTRGAADVDTAVPTADSFDADQVVEGEDNSKRQRPVLESESDDDDEDHSDKEGGVRSQIQSKQRVGSSVSVVKQASGRKRNRSVDRYESDNGRQQEETRRKDDSWKREKDNDRGRGRTDNRIREDDRSKGRDDSRRREKDDRRREDTRGKDKESEYSRNKGDSRGKPRDDNQEKESKDDRRKDRSSKTSDATRDKQQEKNGREEKESSTKSTKADSNNPAATTEEPAKKSMEAFDITTKTGGAYIPPAKLRMMQELITDKTSAAYQRMSWEALKKSINGLINKVNTSNIINIIKELFQENIVRGRGLLARSVIQAQAASPTFTHVYAALVAIINTKFPQNGELILRRLILMFRRGYKRNDKALCLSSTAFIAHLVNQQVAHEVLALEILTLLLENPTDDSVEVAIGFLKECGQKLTEVSPRGINSIFERLRNILHEGQLDVRVQYMVEVMFAIRKDGFKDHPAVPTDLDLVEEEEQFTHLLQLEDAVAADELLNIFKEDPHFAENEEKYKALKKEILDEASSDESGDSSGSESSESDTEDEEKKQTIIDKTETNLVALRRTIYLTVQSSLDHNECAHKMLKMELKPGQEVELCNMILDCCAQLRTYEKFFGLLAQRFCQIDKKYIEPFQRIFMEQYETIHRLETNKVRNVAKFFAHLLHTDAISWGVLSVVKLTEDDTTSASRIFLKILFQELSEYMGLLKLNERLKDITLSPYFTGFMAKDNPKNTRFCINFFTTIGLGGLTDDLREHLKTATKHVVQAAEQAAEAGQASSSSSDSSSEESDSDSSSESESDAPSKKKRKQSVGKSEKKVGDKDSKSKKNAADKENKRASRHKRKSSEPEYNPKNRSKSLGGGSKQMGDKNTSTGKNKRNIADRLLDMAEYGNLQNGEDRTKAKHDGGDRINKDREVRISGNDRDEDRGRRKERGEQGRDGRSQSNGERLLQGGQRWNSSSDRGVGRRDGSVGYGKRVEEKGQRVYDNNDNRRKDRQHEMLSNRTGDGSQRHGDYSSERRFISRSGSARRGQNEHDRENAKDQVSSERRRVFQKGEKGKEKRHDSSSSEESDSSPERAKKRTVRGRSVSSSPDKKGSKKSLDKTAVHKPSSRKRQHDTSDSDSDSSDDSHSKSSKSKKGAVRREKR
ncbi:unnamed protein product [Candidula unifasciata]|uniref:MI domain-containing protein n=1 Tax=Candidula unifasciata TaxID=100452 RepID=A0A8S3Z5K0_9EUPU|nr:unnamed protein product [Candidula unifasciata]